MIVPNLLLKFYLFYKNRKILIWKRFSIVFNEISKNGLKSISFKKKAKGFYNFLLYDNHEANHYAELHLKSLKIIKYPQLIKSFRKDIENDPASFYKNINFKKNKRATVSIILPIYNDYIYTALCLKSLSLANTKISFEVIVIDDSSSLNNKNKYLSHVKNIKLVSNAKNIGYLESCNLGASHSIANFLCMLNNDTFVTDNWLDELYSSFEIFPDAGIVGSQLIYDDLTIQETGSYVFSDGGAVNFGREYFSGHFNVSYTKEVFYCSAASILIRNECFKKVNGFSRAYKPAYYEDVDLSFKLKEDGKLTYCNPFSKVIHFESKSMGLNSSNSIKNQLIEKNKNIFYKKWNKFLPTNFMKLSDIRKIEKSIIIFEENIISPKKDAGSLSIFNFAKLFVSIGYSVTFYFENNKDIESIELLEKNGFRVIFKGDSNHKLKNIKTFLYKHDITPELIYIARPMLFKSLFPVLSKNFPGTFIFYDTVDLHFLRMERERKITSNSSINKKLIDEMRNIELKNIINSSATIVRSSDEIKYLTSSYSIPTNKLLNLSLLYSLPKNLPIFKNTKGIVFVANFNHEPNVDAIKYFLDHIVEHLSERVRNEQLYIVGKNGKRLFSKYSKNNNIKLTFIDYVDDINTFLGQRRVNIAPLRFGAGIKGKIAQALVNGVPTISTSIGFEGMKKNIFKNFLADKPKIFADKLDRLYFDEDYWSQSQKEIVYYSRIWSLDFNQKLIKKFLSKNKLKSSKLLYNVKLL